MSDDFRRVAQEELDKALSFHRNNETGEIDPVGMITWLREAFITLSCQREVIRERVDEIRNHVLSWDETQKRPFTVDDAKILNVCRICKKPSTPEPDNPLMLNFGEEFAHQKCLYRKDEISSVTAVLKKIMDRCGCTQSGMMCTPCYHMKEVIYYVQKRKI